MTTETNAVTEANAPLCIAFHVADRESKNRWIRLGTFFAHHYGKGGTLVLDSLLIGFDGRIVMRAPIME